MVIKKMSGNMDVLDAGSLLTFSNTSDIQFCIEFDESFSFDLVLKFESNGEKKHQIKSSIDDNTIVLTCLNFDSALGTGTSSPIQLAVFNGKKVYINFWVFSLGQNNARKVSYTLYREK